MNKKSKFTGSPISFGTGDVMTVNMGKLCSVYINAAHAQRVHIFHGLTSSSQSWKMLLEEILTKKQHKVSASGTCL